MSEHHSKKTMNGRILTEQDWLTSDDFAELLAFLTRCELALPSWTGPTISKVQADHGHLRYLAIYTLLQEALGWTLPALGPWHADLVRASFGNPFRPV